MVWESAEKVQKNSNGEYRALIGGQWVPVPRAQKSADGQYRVERSTPAPVAESTTSGLENFAAGTMRGLLSPVRAAERYGSKLVQAVGREIGRNTDSGMYEPVLQDFGQSDEDRAAADRADAPLLATSGGQIGNLVGEAVISAVPTGAMYNTGRGLLYGGTKVLPKVLASMGSGTASGIAGAAITGHDSPEELMTAAGIGSAAPLFHAASYGAGKLWDFGSKKIAGTKGLVNQYLQDMLGNRTSGAAAALDDLSSPIGEKLSSGYASLADNGAYPELMLLNQDAAIGRLGGKANQLEQANRDIRANILRRQAEPGVRPIGPDGNLANSPIMDYRDEVAGTLLKRADPQPVVLNPRLENAVGSALIKSSENKAGAMIDTRDALRELRGIRPSLIPQEGGVTQGWGPRGPYPGESQTIPIDTVENLDAARKRIQKALSGTNLQPDEIPVMKGVRQELTDRIRAASPDYADGMDNYAGLSRIQNQADYAANLLRTLEPLQGSRQRFTETLSRMDNAPAILKDIGAPGSYQTPEALFNNAPGKLAEINRLRSAVEREVKYDQLPGRVSSIENFEAPLSQLERSAPPLFTKEVTIGKRIAKLLGSRQEEKALDYLDNLVLNPNEMAKALRTVPLKDRYNAVNALRRLAAQRGNQIVGGTMGAIAGQQGEEYAP
jgi:hypothetical protein